jgi:glycosyltransferase involved in cell wall biosynthesis
LAEDIIERFSKRACFIPPTLDHILQSESKIYNVDPSSPLRVGWTGTYSSFNYLNFLIPELGRLVASGTIEFVVISDRAPSMPFKFEFIKWNITSEVADLKYLDVGIYPVPSERWALGKSGLKVLQYMSAGLCTISSNYGMAKEYVSNSDNGFLAESLDDWSNILSELAENRSLVSSTGKSARRWAIENLSESINRSLYLKVIEEAVCEYT